MGCDTMNERIEESGTANGPSRRRMRNPREECMRKGDQFSRCYVAEHVVKYLSKSVFVFISGTECWSIIAHEGGFPHVNLTLSGSGGAQCLQQDGSIVGKRLLLTANSTPYSLHS
ncbi:hypothetical protein ElyMa_004992900 [Elysia marginata]|uniref:Uncharacterized protein n=1 Tax=Elysia marginata TaxID=1093978 RepID=A0AAV4JB84_9GAST|nr:hypothetical protein ElyMa_004992900 [Elysia marginata]